MPSQSEKHTQILVFLFWAVASNRKTWYLPQLYFFGVKSYNIACASPI